MPNSIKLGEILPQVKVALAALRKAIPFAFEHKLWSGFFKHGWIAFFSIVVSAIFTYVVFTEISHSFFTNTPETTALSAIDLSNVEDGIKEGGRESLFSGGIKYLLLILLEVVIFYFSIKTMASLKGEEITFSMKDFIRAEKRMIKVMFINYIYALLLHIAVSIAIAFTDADFLKPALLFLIYAYFIGYAFLDNFYEQQGLDIKESRLKIQQELGAATTLGIFASLVLYIPFLGPLLAPIIFAIAATLYGAQVSGLIETVEAQVQPDPAMKSSEV